MTREEASIIIGNIPINGDGCYPISEYQQAKAIAIQSLEALGKIKKEIDDSILICQKHAQNNDWCDGELAGFLQSKDIIDRNLSEVSE